MDVFEYIAFILTIATIQDSYRNGKIKFKNLQDNLFDANQNSGALNNSYMYIAYIENLTES